jgi:hypothetical protein
MEDCAVAADILGRKKETKYMGKLGSDTTFCMIKKGKEPKSLLLPLNYQANQPPPPNKKEQKNS